MMQEQPNAEELPEASKDPSRLDIIGGLAATEGFSNLINIDKVLNEIDDSIVFVDKSFKDLVATMGRGEDYASGFGKVLEATAKEIILAGGKREDAAKIQIETINVMGRASMLSQKQAVDLFNASKVTGVASKDLSTAFLDSGRNLSNISKEMLAVREVAQSLGANAKQVSSLVVSNLDKLNRFSFQGGVEGLARMAANSQTLRIGMESTLDLADELIDPEKAIEMASEFQRMGVASEALTNPLRLMDMAQNDVEGLQKEIGDALSEFVTIGEDGTKTISTQGRRIMKQLAASGVMTRGELEKLAIGTREIQDKMSKISFSGLNLDEDTQKLIANVAQLGEGGVYEIQTKNKDGDIVTKSIQQFVQDLGGDQEKIREALLSQEEKTGDASKDMGAIAQGQLDVLTKIKQSNDALLAAIGFTVSAGKTGPELLKVSAELNKFINSPLFKQVGSESPIGKGLDNTAVEIKNALEKFKSGELDQSGLMKLIKDVGGAGGKLAGQFGEAGLTVVKDYAKQFGIGEETVDSFINGIKENLPEAKQQGVDLLYAVLDGMNEMLESVGIKIPDSLKREKEEEKKTEGTGGGTTPLPVPDNKKGGTGGGTTPLPTPQQGKGGDEGLLFLEDLQNLDLQQLTSQLIQPLEKLDVGTSEVGTLNVQNLVIGSGLEKIITPKEGEPLIKQEQVESVVKPTVTPTLVQPSIDISQPIPQEELPTVPETTEELPSLKKVVEEPKEDKKGFFEKVNNFVQELKTEPVKENLNVNEVLKPVPTTEPSEITKTFETSLDNISKLKMPELGIFKKEEQKPSNLVKEFEDSAKKMADLKIGGLEEKPKIELGKPEEKTEEGLFDKKPSILGKFISKKQSETEEEPKEEKKGKFSKIKDAFVKSFIEPEKTQEEYETIVPKYGEELSQIEPIAPVTEEPTSIGRTIDELEPTTTDISVKPELTEEVKETEPITQLKIDTSEVGTLNVQNLNIGTALDGIVNTLGTLPQNQTQLTTLEGLDLEGAVTSAVAGETEGQIQPEAAVVKTTPTEEGLPEATATLNNTSVGFGRTSPAFLEMEYGSKPPSEYEKFKKLLEQNYGGEIIGTGDETTLITPEMKAQAKKNSEFIGPEKPTSLTGELESKVEIPTKKIELGGPKKLMGLSEKFNPKIESTRSITPPTKEELYEIEKEIELESYYKKFDEINDEIGNFKKEKIGVEGKGAMNEEDLGILEHMGKRYDEYEKKIMDLESGEVESFDTKIESKGLIEDKGLAPIKPTLASLPIPEKEEKQPLGERIKSGVGKIKDKFKKEEKIEPEAATTQGEQPKYVVKDAEGNILSESIDKETASKKAGIAGLGIEPELVETPVTETPAVGVEQVASEEKQPLGKRLKEGIGDLAQKGKDKVKEKVELVRKEIDEVLYPEEQVNKIETPAVGVEKVTTETEEKTPLKERLKEGFGKKEKPSPFGLDMKMFEQKLPEPPKASLEKTKTDKIDVKAIEDSVPNEEDTRSALEKVSLTAAEDEGFEGGIIEPVEPVTITPEVDKEKEETKARSFAYLEELRLREQTPTVPETPAKGIEKIAQLGQKFEGKIGRIKEKLFGKKEEESSLSEYEPEVSTEEPYMSESIKEDGTEDYRTLAEEAESEYTPTTVGAIEEVAPSIPEPTVYPFAQLQEFMGQGAGAGQTASQSENTQNINMNVKLEIVGNSEFAKLIDPRQFQQKIESIMTTSIGKTQIAQRFNSATSTEVASMGLNDTNGRRR